MKSFLPIVGLLAQLVLTSCQPVTLTTERDPQRGQWHTQATKEKDWRGYDWAAFKDSVKRPIARELAGQTPPARMPDWNAYWIWRAELLNYTGKPEWIDYITLERRKNGLPEIREIVTRDLRTPWQFFTNTYDAQIEQEARSAPPPSQFRSWSDYWLHRFELLRQNKNIGEAGVAYIVDKRYKMHLPPLPTQ